LITELTTMKYVTLATLMFCLLVLTSYKRTSNYGIGDSVSDFKLKNVDGKFVGLSDYKKSKGVILIFDCNTCPFSKAYNERIIALNEKFAPLGFPVVTINSNDPEQSEGDSFEAMVDLAKRQKYSFPYLFDETQNVAKSFGATNTPHVFVLKNDNGSFKVSYIGAIDNNPRDGSAASKKYVENAVNELLQNKPVSTTKTKALGCGIKYKES
jgi:peroxiredoxin